MIKALDGWQRLGVVLMLLWLTGVIFFTTYEYQAVSRGDSPTRFVVLRDAQTHRKFGRLSLSEVKELGELTLRKSLSPQAEPGDAEEARFLLAATPQPVLHYETIATWVMLPVACFWALFASVRWVAAGFRKPT